MNIDIRPLHTHAEFQAAEDVQVAVWGSGAVPTQLLIVAHEHGGLALGAFATDTAQLIGMVFGFVGRTTAGQIHHHSHLAAVLEQYRNQQIGYRLKLAQRDYVLAQGIDHMTWTYDPLESRNAALNLHKLGAICRTYQRNLYGEMNDTFNAGLPSDRFLVDWYLRSPHVAQRANRPTPTVAQLRTEGVQLLNPNPPLEGVAVADRQGERVLIAIPAAFQTLKRADPAAAHAWRFHTRALFEAAFAAGYSATDLLTDDQHSYYLLEKDWR